MMRRTVAQILLICLFVFYSNAAYSADGTVINPNHKWHTFTGFPTAVDDPDDTFTAPDGTTERLEIGDVAWFYLYFDQSDHAADVGGLGDRSGFYINVNGTKTQCNPASTSPSSSPPPCASAPIFIAAPGVIMCRFQNQHGGAGFSDTTADTGQRRDLFIQLVALSDQNGAGTVAITGNQPGAQKNRGLSDTGCIEFSKRTDGSTTLSVSNMWISAHYPDPVNNPSGSAHGANELDDLPDGDGDDADAYMLLYIKGVGGRK